MKIVICWNRACRKRVPIHKAIKDGPRSFCCGWCKSAREKEDEEKERAQARKERFIRE